MPFGPQALKLALLHGVEHGEEDAVGLLAAAEVVEGGKGEIGEAGRGPAVLVDLESVGAVFLLPAAQRCCKST